MCVCVCLILYILHKNAYIIIYSPLARPQERAPPPYLLPSFLPRLSCVTLRCPVEDSLKAVCASKKLKFVRDGDIALIEPQ